MLDSATDQSPGISTNEVGRSPSPSQSSLTRGWEAARFRECDGEGGCKASARSWLKGESFFSTLVRFAQSSSKRLAAKVCKAAPVNKDV